MAKSKSQDPEPKRSGSKRKEMSSIEQDVSVDVNVEIKVKKKKKKDKRDREEEPFTTLSKPVSEEAPAVEKIKKHKQPTENTQEKEEKKKKKKEKKKKKKKEKKSKISEPAEPLERQEEVMEGEEDLSPEERRVLERKMKKILKKEKKNLQKMEGVTEETPKPVATQQALDYLSCWAKNRKEWKFQKTRQTWLLQHMFDPEKVPDQSFTVLLQYLEGLQGAAKDTTVKKAEALTREHEGSEEEEALKKTHRAREIIQLLS